MRECGVAGCYLPLCLPRSACPILHHTESALSVYLCANVGPQGLLVVGLPALFIPHSASLGPATATGVLSTPVPVSAPPTGLDECLFLFPWCRTSLLFNFPSVLVVKGGAMCLPMPPSWFHILLFLTSSFEFQDTHSPRLTPTFLVTFSHLLELLILQCFKCQ